MPGLGMGLGLGLSKGRSSAFSPASLFAGGAKGVWIDPSDLSTLYSDRAGTTPAAVDGLVGKMLDKSGRGNHLTATSDASRAYLRQSGSIYWIEMIAGTTGYDMASGRTWEVSSDVYFGFRNVGRLGWIMLADTSGGSTGFGIASNGAGTPTYANVGTPTDEVEGIVVASTRGALYDAFGDGVDKVEGVIDATLASLGTVNFGGYAGFELGGRFYGLIICSANSARASLRTYMAAKQGRTL